MIVLKTIIFAHLLLISNLAMSQFRKGTWMIGGSGHYSSTKDVKSPLGFTKSKNISLNPYIGYFIKDKFVIGFKMEYIYTDLENIGTGLFSSDLFGGGAFTRYYFLQNDHPFNIFSEVNFLYQFAFNPKEQIYNLGLDGGIVAFFNSVIGLELSIGYNHNTSSKRDIKFKTFHYNAGLQIYLSRE